MARPMGLVMLCTIATPGRRMRALGHPVQRDEIGRVSHVVIRLDHQHLGEQFALREVPIRRRETLIGRGIVRLVLTVVVVHPVRRHEDRPEHDGSGTGREDRHRPPHHARPDPPIQMRLGLAVSDRRARKGCPTVKMAGPERQRGRDGKQHGDGNGGPHGVEVVESRESQAVTRPRDRQPRANDDRRDALDTRCKTPPPCLRRPVAPRDSGPSRRCRNPSPLPGSARRRCSPRMTRARCTRDGRGLR